MSITKPTLLILFIYSLAHLPLFLLGDARYWDDWLVLSVGPVELHKMFSDIGLPWITGFHTVMRPLGGFGYHLSAFLSFGIAALLLPSILKTCGVDEKPAFWTAALFAVIPLNEARVAAIVGPYSLCYGLFFIGWYFMTQSKDNKKETQYRCMSLAAFFISYSTESLLVFYALPLALLLHSELRMHRLVKSIARNLDFIALPFVFFAIKTFFFKPLGATENYNKIELSNISYLPHFISIFFDEMMGLLTPPATYGLIILLTAVIVLVQKSNFRRECVDFILHKRDDPPMEVLGLVALLLAFIPYCMVGLHPSYVEWESRNQLLLPLGLALIGCGSIMRIHDATIKPYSLILLTVLGIISWHRSYADFYVDWLKQQAIIGELKKNPEIRATQSLLWVDLAPDMNALQREYRIYDFSGLLYFAYGTQDHYVVPYSKFARLHDDWAKCVSSDRIYFNTDNLMGALTNPPPPKLIIISRTSKAFEADNHYSYAMTMALLKITKPKIFDKKLEALMMIDGPINVAAAAK